MQAPVLKPVLAVYTALFILFIYGPFFVLGILSFQQGPEGGPQFPIVEWSIYWYQHIFGLQYRVLRVSGQQAFRHYCPNPSVGIE